MINDVLCVKCLEQLVGTLAHCHVAVAEGLEESAKRPAERRGEAFQVEGPAEAKQV